MGGGPAMQCHILAMVLAVTLEDSLSLWCASALQTQQVDNYNDSILCFVSVNISGLQRIFIAMLLL